MLCLTCLILYPKMGFSWVLEDENEKKKKIKRKRKRERVVLILDDEMCLAMDLV